MPFNNNSSRGIHANPLVFTPFIEHALQGIVIPSGGEIITTEDSIMLTTESSQLLITE